MGLRSEINYITAGDGMSLPSYDGGEYTSFWGDIENSSWFGAGSMIAEGMLDVSKASSDADSLRLKAEWADKKADEILRQASEQKTDVSRQAMSIRGTQTAVLAGMGVSASGSLAELVKSDTSKEEARTITSIDAGAQYQVGMAEAEAKAYRDAANDLEDSIFGTILGTAVGVGVGLYTGNFKAGMAAGKLTTAIV